MRLLSERLGQHERPTDSTHSSALTSSICSKACWMMLFFSSAIALRTAPLTQPPYLRTPDTQSTVWRDGGRPPPVYTTRRATSAPPKQTRRPTPSTLTHCRSPWASRSPPHSRLTFKHRGPAVSLPAASQQHPTPEAARDTLSSTDTSLRFALPISHSGIHRSAKCTVGLGPAPLQICRTTRSSVELAPFFSVFSGLRTDRWYAASAGGTVELARSAVRARGMVECSDDALAPVLILRPVSDLSDVSGWSTHIYRLLRYYGEFR